MAHWFQNRIKQAGTSAPASGGGIRAVDHKQLLRLMHAISGQFYMPCDAGYPAAARQFDPLYQRAPIAVAMCKTVADIQACIQWCNELGVQASFRSGGHSTAGYSVLDGTLTVDLSGLDHVEVDGSVRCASVQPGVNFSRLNAALDKFDLHVPGGGCGSVCVAGYMQGGGYGFTARCFGMNCDHVTQIEYLTNKGEVQTASAAENKDLFWALRGGTGGNFGVITRIDYALHKLGTVWGFGLAWDLDAAPAALEAIQAQFMRSGPESIGYMVFIMPRRDPVSGKYRTGLFMRGMCIAGAETGRALLAPLAKAGGVYDLDKEGTYSFLNGYLLADLEPQVFGYELKVSNYIAATVPRSGWQEVVGFFKRSPTFDAANANTLVLEPYGGRIPERSARTDNAFIHRDVDMNFVVDSFYGTPDERKPAEDWLALFSHFLRGPGGQSNGQVYQNYPEPDLAGWDTAYFGAALPRLRNIKRAADAGTEVYPDGFFSFPQSIKPAR